MVEIRRHLHRHPELSFQENETTDFILGKLKNLNIPTDRPLDTGCVGVLEGGKGSDRVIALRADIDALAISEEGTHKAAFMSENQGVAHCCGHDAHTANLLGTAAVLKELQEEIEGTVLLVFQPGEENLPGGGRLLCETGYLQGKGVDAIYGLHTSPFFKPGQIAVRKGPRMARPDEFTIEIIGKGGHAAAPQDAVDPIVISAQVVSAIQNIVSRNIDPNDAAVVTVGRINGGTAHNIIPEKVEMIGTVRTFSQQTADFIKRRLEAIVKGITGAAGATYRFDFNYGYPAVMNDGRTTDVLLKAASELVRDKNIRHMDKPVMAGEDFAFYQQHFPGTFFFLGSGSEKSGSVYPWHHPKYNIDEECFKTGAALMASLVFGN
ncbi:MAG: M20 metallopeptidase family protein [Balneolaceae bacterium]